MSAKPSFSGINVGQPVRHHNLSVFPLFSTVAGTKQVDYLLSDEAVATGTLVVEEVDEQGSVPTLRVTNRGEHRVLFLEGEELRGAKQNRVLNTSVLIAAHALAEIPVSCVEQGRWRQRSKHFMPSEHGSSSKLRQELKKSVSRSLREGHGHESDQCAVWSEVDRQMHALSASSPTMAMADTYESQGSRIDEYRKSLGYVDGAVGLAVAVGSKVLAIDLFDKPATCRKVWDRLLSGFIMDALEESQDEPPAGTGEVDALLKSLQGAPWQESPAVGEGREYRAEAPPQTHASALTLDASLLHGSAVLA